MPVEIRVPQLGESVLEAVVAKWLKHVGDAVAVGDPLVELETEKVNQEIYADQSGVLGAIHKHDGETVGVGEVLGTLDGADVKAGAAAADPESTPGPSAPQAKPAHSGARTADSSAPATPVARRLAGESGLDLTGLQGTGPGGRITKGDVSAALDRTGTQTGAPADQAVAEPVPAGRPSEIQQPTGASQFGAPASSAREQRIRMSRRRQTIARRLVEAQQTAAMLTTFNEVDMSAINDVRKRRRDSFKERYGVGLGFMSFFTKATVGALKAFPRLNAEIQGDEFVLKRYYDIGIAVGTDEGLVVPVVREADGMTFAEIERAITELAGKARGGSLALTDLSGGTFTITNGGIYGSLLSTPILNTPQVGILGMHKIQERPIAINGEVKIRPMMYVALSYDHRIVDGSEAVRFLVRIKELLEDPESLLLEG